MAGDAVPERVRRLIAERIHSVPELEALLLFHGDRSVRWSAEEAGRRLYVSTAVAGYILAELTRRRFFECTEEQLYVYAPEPGIEETVDQLATTYSGQLIAITNLIHGKPSASVREFADAFRLRKGK